MEESDNSANRMKVIAEIVNSERTYYHDLQTLLIFYKNPLFLKAKSFPFSPSKSRTDSKIPVEFSHPAVTYQQVPQLSIQDINTIFCNVEAIVQVSSQVLSEFSTYEESDVDESTRDQRALYYNIGKAFLAFAPTLKLYTAYATSYKRALEKHQELLAKNVSYNVFCQKCVSHSDCARGDLASYLILGIQRVPRYRLLLESLISMSKNGIITSEERSNLELAYKQVLVIAKEINSGVDDFERREEVLKLQVKFIGCGELVKPHRVFIMEGDLMKLYKKKYKSCRFVLFNDSIMYGERIRQYKCETYKFCKLLELKNAKFLALPNGVEFVIYERSDSGANKALSVRASAKTREERDMWLKTISKYRDEAFDPLVCADELAVRRQDITASKPSKRSLLKRAETSLGKKAENQLSTRKRTTSSGSTASVSSSDSTYTFTESYHAGSQIQDAKDVSNKCSYCESEFGFFCKTIRCYKCARVCCDNCTQNKWQFDTDDDDDKMSQKSARKLRRVCLSCYRLMYFDTFGCIPTTTKLIEEQEDKRGDSMLKTKLIPARHSLDITSESYTSSSNISFDLTKHSSSGSVSPASDSTVSTSTSNDVTSVDEPENWKEVSLSTGEKYFINTKTNDVRWDISSKKPISKAKVEGTYLSSTDKVRLKTASSKLGLCKPSGTSDSGSEVAVRLAKQLSALASDTRPHSTTSFGGSGDLHHKFRNFRSESLSSPILQHRSTVNVTRFYTLEELRNEPFPEGIDTGQREQYLNDKVFEATFKMDKRCFDTLPLWKRVQLKKANKLF